MAARIDFKCACGVRLAGPYDVMFPLVKDHLIDTACPFHKPAPAVEVDAS